ncbi:MAG: hypothetical protein WBQ21_00095 [Solirubrobacteraceae bacterium]
MEPITVVVVGAIVLFVLVGVGSVMTGGSLYDKIGEGGLSGGPSTPTPTNTAQGQAEQELEIRQMLRARSERRVRNGEPALDIDAELAQLLQPSSATSGKHDVGLTEEVRQLVVARNERRVRGGEDPMDVEAEVERTLRELDPNGV